MPMSGIPTHMANMIEDLANPFNSSRNRSQVMLLGMLEPVVEVAVLIFRG
jgi:hypothetical protein